MVFRRRSARARARTTHARTRARTRTAVCVERVEGLHERAAVLVLVVHQRAHPHERSDLRQGPSREGGSRTERQASGNGEVATPVTGARGFARDRCQRSAARPSSPSNLD